MTKENIGTETSPGLGRGTTSDETLPTQRSLGIALVIVGGSAGLALRYLTREHATVDALQFLIPWYSFARDHGINALNEPFTNYTPFFSYLLLIAAHFDWLGQPLFLVKMISAVFEFGCAIVVAQMVWRTTRVQLRSSLAFCAVWLAPTMIFNGALWGQADSIWTFFTLISVTLFMRDRNGVLSFAVAFSVKAQGIFLGPFVLGMILRRRIHAAWLATIPVVYVVLAIPVLVAGRSLVSVLEVYKDQANTFDRLFISAANLWIFAAGTPYMTGVAVGLVLAAASGLALSIFIAESKRKGPEFVLLAACVSLMLMPYLLPKMHERYFYAFELASIALSCINPRYLPFAIIAQVDGVMAYLAFDRGIVMGLPPAALCNTFLAFYLVLDLWRGERGFHFSGLAWLGFTTSTAGLLCYLVIAGSGWNMSFAYLFATGLATAMTVRLLKASQRTSACSQKARGSTLRNP